jgi:hypothetical protein
VRWLRWRREACDGLPINVMDCRSNRQPRFFEPLLRPSQSETPPTFRDLPQRFQQDPRPRNGEDAGESLTFPLCLQPDARFGVGLVRGAPPRVLGSIGRPPP